MSNLVQGFLDDIVAHPEDSSLWLILADWLEDQDDPRAELVRLTWSLQYEPNHPEFPVRQARLQELLARGMQPVRPRVKLAPEIEFAWIAPGTFLMGSPLSEAKRQDNEVQHRVTLTQGFWMGVTPITQEQWQTVTGTNPSHFSRKGHGQQEVASISDADLARYPVEMISFNMAEAFCDRLSQEWDCRVRLPTEAEWEYACRAGTTTPYHFGNILNATQANCDGNYNYGGPVGPYRAQPCPVGSFAPNAWGLYDMHGNVREWCQDQYRSDPESLPEVDPISTEVTPGHHLPRGGSWFATAWYCRSATREHAGDGSPTSRMGLRLVMTVE